MKILTGRVVAITLGQRAWLRVLSEADKRKFLFVKSVTTFRQALWLSFDMQYRGRTSTWIWTTLTMQQKSYPVIYDEKQIPLIRHDMFNRTGSKILSADFWSVNRERRPVLTWRMKTSEKMSACLTNPLKVKAAENKELARVKNRMLCWSWKQNEEIKRLARERARTWRNESLLKKWLKLACLKVKEKQKDRRIV